MFSAVAFLPYQINRPHNQRRLHHKTNPSTNNSRIVRLAIPLAPEYQTTASGPNSAITCRQAPQGEQGAPRRFTTATATIAGFRALAATAAKMALRSAQIVSPYDAFSTLHPVKMRPSSSSTAAPTWNFEYGAYAHFIAARARFSNVSRIRADEAAFFMDSFNMAVNCDQSFGPNEFEGKPPFR
jgi:hypothetical protein